jgi:hypothetical protein
MESLLDDTKHKYNYPKDWNDIKRRIKHRDGYKCRLCGSSSDLHVHHIVPISRYPDHSDSNLITLCFSCHSKQDGTGHNLLISALDRSRNEKMRKYSFKYVECRKDYICDCCRTIISKGTHSYKKNYWSNSSIKSNGKKIPDSTIRICELCFIMYPRG